VIERRVPAGAGPLACAPVTTRAESAHAVSSSAARAMAIDLNTGGPAEATAGSAASASRSPYGQNVATIVPVPWLFGFGE
jgi:hypothetical protein